MTDYKLSGEEFFTNNGEETKLSIMDFWRWHFCDRFDLQDKFAEYIVAKSLGLETADNVGSWTLFDILYRDTRIEVKETSYYHSWQTDDEPKSEARSFGITKAYSEYQDSTSTFERQNDIYVFCLNTGKTRKESDPLKLEHWEFYIVKTSVINDLCGDRKTISLSRLKKITSAIPYDEIKPTVDKLITEINMQ